MKSLIAFFIGLFSFFHMGSGANSNQFAVTTSFYPLYFFASRIGGTKVSVTTITPAGAEPHDYEPTPQDFVTMQNSRLLIINGGIEPWAAKIQADLAGKSTAILQVSPGLVSGVDPHIWLDPVLAKQISQRIFAQFVRLDPQDQSYFQSNLTFLNQQLDQLDSSYRSGLANCAQKSFVTSHAAFSYLAARYGLNQVAISGLSPDAEPSLKDLATLANFARTNRIKYIFFESLATPKLANTLAGEIGAQTLVLDPLEGLTPSAVSQGNTYITVMQQNLKNLRIALSCS